VQGVRGITEKIVGSKKERQRERECQKKKGGERKKS
jgi:hypothetical protein